MFGKDDGGNYLGTFRNGYDLSSWAQKKGYSLKPGKNLFIVGQARFRTPTQYGQGGGYANRFLYGSLTPPNPKNTAPPVAEPTPPPTPPTPEIKSEYTPPTDFGPVDEEPPTPIPPELTTPMPAYQLETGTTGFRGATTYRDQAGMRARGTNSMKIRSPFSSSGYGLNIA